MNARLAPAPQKQRATGQPAKPRRPEPARPPLRVVDDKVLMRRTRRRRVRLLVFLSSVVLAVCLFATAATHVALTQKQFRLDKVERQTASEQARYDELRLKVAELESPERIVAAAHERLGMLFPPDVTYLAPPSAPPTAPAPGETTTKAITNDGDVPQAEAAKVDPGTAQPEAEAAPGDWSTLKPHLVED